MSAESIVAHTDFNIRIPDRRILHRLGYKASAEINSTVQEMIEETKSTLDEMIQPVAIYSVLDYEQTNRHPVFAGAKKVALCLCTIGPRLEELSASFIRNNEMLKGFILDAFGSEAAEEVARQSDGIIARSARDLGFKPSKRFSPGYGIWDIREQAYIFQVLPGGSIGVRLTETYMMVPRKSVSFRINFLAEDAESR